MVLIRESTLEFNQIFKLLAFYFHVERAITAVVREHNLGAFI